MNRLTGIETAMEYIENNRKGVYIQGLIPGRLLARYASFTATSPAKEDDNPDESLDDFPQN